MISMEHYGTLDSNIGLNEIQVTETINRLVRQNRCDN